MYGHSDIESDESILILTTGWNGIHALGDTETFVVSSSSRKLTRCQPLPYQTQTMYPMVGGTGGVIKVSGNHQHFPIVCGGNKVVEATDKCYLAVGNVTEAKPVSKFVGFMKEPRENAASITVFNGTTLWVTGGSLLTTVLATSELISLSATESNHLVTAAEKGIPLPMTLACHCLELINSKTAIIYGGSNGYGAEDYTSSVWTIDNIDEKSLIQGDNGTNQENRWIQGPPLGSLHRWHSCGVIRQDISNKSSSGKFVIAAGGDMFNGIVELLQVDEDEYGHITIVENAWELGPEMPIKISEAASVTTEDKAVLFVAGGWQKVELQNEVSNIMPSRDIFTLRCFRGDCFWTKETLQLEIRRTSAIALLVPPAIQNGSAEGKTTHPLY